MRPATCTGTKGAQQANAISRVSIARLYVAVRTRARLVIYGRFQPWNNSSLALELTCSLGKIPRFDSRPFFRKLAIEPVPLFRLVVHTMADNRLQSDQKHRTHAHIHPTIHSSSKTSFPHHSNHHPFNHSRPPYSSLPTSSSPSPPPPHPYTAQSAP